MTVAVFDSAKPQTTSTQREFFVSADSRRQQYSVCIFLINSFESYLRLWQDVEFESDSVSHSLKSLFIERIRDVPQVERVFWKQAGERVRVWTIIDQPDVEVENRIYDSELEVMDLMPDVQFDFSVIFRLGKAPSAIRPEGAMEVFSRS